MKTTLAALFYFAAALLSFGQEVGSTMLPPSRPVSAGGDATVALVRLNGSGQATTSDFPSLLKGRLIGSEREWPLELRNDQAGPVEIAAGGFVRRNYAFAVPADAKGRLILEVTAPAPLQVVLDVADGGSSPMAAPGGKSAKLSPSQAAVRDITSSVPQPAASHLRRTFVDHFSEHYPCYFLYGPDDPVAKFQFSFKYRMVGDTPESGRPRGVFNGLHFGYTQRSLWDIRQNSSPFFDTSYMPELLFESLAPEREDRTAWLHWISYQVGAQHESNGRDGASSRSLNMAYVRPAFLFGRLDGWNLLVAPKIYAYVGDLSDNRDIADYRGYCDFYAVFGKNDSLAVSLTGRKGRVAHRGSVEVNLTYPLRFELGNFASFFQIQYFSGWGESLRTYDQKTSAIRAGFSIVR
jgi:phospholipase A1